MSNNNSILIFIDWFLPAYKAGGPVQSVANFVFTFRSKLNISIITSDRDLGDTAPYVNIPVCQWIQKENYRVMYLDPVNQTRAFYKTIFDESNYQYIYLNSFFSVPFTLKPLFIAKKRNIKLVLAPRGMLGEGALQIKPLRKTLFIAASKLLGIYNRVIWHATAESEKEEIINIFGKGCDIKVAPNLPSIRLSENILREKKPDSLNLFFVSRIALKKNLLNSLKWLNKVSSFIKINFFIIGPVDEVSYWTLCQNEIKAMALNIKVNYLGSVPNKDLANYLVNYHFLYLPTLNENYGHAIIESFQCGCPVIISDRTPWRNLKEKGVGWDIPLDQPDQFVRIIEHCAAMGQEEYDAMSRKAFEYAKQVTEDPEVLEANRRLFE